MLMAVYDSVEPCGNDCQTSLGLVGATQEGFGRRGKDRFNVPVSEKLLCLKLYNMIDQIYFLTPPPQL